MIKQTTLARFLNLPSASDSSDESAYSPSEEIRSKAIPSQWTRVRSRAQMSGKRVTVFDIQKDLDVDKALKAVRKGAVRKDGELLFDPDEWKGRSEELTIEHCGLQPDALREHAVLAS